MGQQVMGLLISVFLAGFSAQAIAAIPSKQKQLWINQEGALRGGKAGSGFSLVGLTRKALKDGKVERLSIQIGDIAMQPLRGPVGYYHAELSANPPKLVINFSQTLNSKFENREILKVIQGSQIIKKSDLFFDPVAQSLSLHLELKTTASVKAISFPGKGQQKAQLVFDLVASKPITKKVKK